MINFILHLLGTRVLDAKKIADWSLEFRYGAGGWVVLLAVALAVGTVWLYRRTTLPVPPWARYGMAALRGVLFLLILVLLLQPVLQLGIDSKVRRGLVVLLDASASMKIQDKDVTREARVREKLPELLKTLAEEFDLIPYAFGKELTELPATNLWAGYLPASSVTALGDAVREALQRQRGQSMAGAFVVTDGGNNSGSAPLDAAMLARQENFPLYLYGVGDTAPKDIIVASLFAEDVAFVKDELTVTVRVRSQGLAGEHAQVELKLGDKVVGEKEVLFATDAEQVVEMKFTPDQTGEFDLQAVIAPRADETVKDNNSQTKRIRVVDTKIKVLVIEQSPRWEYRYLSAMLLRDRRMDVKLLLFEADPGVTQGANSPYLQQFPKQKEELFQYDVILLGDVDPKLFTAEQLDALRDYVAKFGGALVMIAGKRYAPQAYAHTALEAALPVEVEQGGGEAPADKPLQLEVTTAGKESPMLQLADKPEASLAVWRDLPLLYWIARVGRVKPAAEVLLATREKLPVLVLQRYGLGQMLFMGTDSTWRWRKNVGDKYFTLLWSQIVQRMALSRLLGAAKRTQLSSDRQAYVTGDRVTVYARLYNATFDPVNEAVVKGRYAVRGVAEGAGMSEREVTLRPLPNQPGMYRGEYVAPAQGAYKFYVERDAETQLDFVVREPKFEFGQTAMNAELLKEMAATSGGAFFRDEDLARLPEAVGKQVETIRTYIEVEVWSSPLVFTLLALVAVAEWLLRKKFQLK